MMAGYRGTRTIPLPQKRLHEEVILALNGYLEKR